MKNQLCPYPWLGMHFLNNGELMVCPASQSSPSKGLIGQKWSKDLSFLELRNSDNLKLLRSEMLKGQKPAEYCQRCLAEENNGMLSWREKHSDLFLFSDEELRRSTKVDGSISEDVLPLQQLSLRIGNKCNLKCQMCHPSSSRALYPEWFANEGPRFRVGGEKIHLLNKGTSLLEQVNPFLWFDDFVEAVRGQPRLLDQISLIHFSGGEPLLEKSHQDFIEHLIETGHASRVILDYSSNLTVLPGAALDAWKNFKKVRIGVSWDGRRRAQSYIRFPIDYEVFLKNVHRLDQAQGNYEIWANSTLGALNILDFPYYLEELLDHNFRRLNILNAGSEGQKFYISYHLLRKPEELSLDMISDKGYREIENLFKERRPILEEKTSRRFKYFDSYEVVFEAILKSLRSPRPSSEDSSNFWKKLERRDVYRKINFSNYVPEIASIINR